MGTLKECLQDRLKDEELRRKREALEDEEDFKAIREALEEFEKNPKTHTLEEVEKELGIG